MPPKRERLKVRSVCSFGMQLVLSKIVEEFKLDELLDRKLLAPGHVERYRTQLDSKSHIELL